MNVRVSHWLDPLQRILDRSPERVRFAFRHANVRVGSECVQEMLEVFAAYQIDTGLRVETEGAGDPLGGDVATLTSDHAQAHRSQWAETPLLSKRKAEGQEAGALSATRTCGGEGTPANARARTTFASPGEPAATRVVAPGPVAGHATVDWRRNRDRRDTATLEDLGRRIAVAASRRQSVSIIVDYAQVSDIDPRALDELLAVLADHRNVECLHAQPASRFLATAGGSAGQPIRSRVFDPQANTTLPSPAVRPHGFDAWWPANANPRRFGHPWLWGALGAVLIGLGSLWYYGGAPAPRYLTAAVARGDIENSVLAAGVVQPNEFVDLGAQISGQLKNLHVQLGEKVVKGQLLAEIDPIISASKVVEAEATLANLQAQWEGKKEQLALARRQQARSYDLFEQGAQAASESEIADSNLKIAHSGLSALDAQIKQARAALETARANLSYTRISAPMAGEVVSITAREGQTLNASQQTPTILRIAVLDTMTVSALVPEADVARLRVGQEVYFTVLGQGDRRWQGRLRQILPSPEIIANVVFYNALFDVPNARRELKVQMTAQVFFVLEHGNNVLYVPLAAVSTAKGAESKKHTVRVLRGDGRVEERNVKVGIRNLVAAQILAGLTEGERVVVGQADETSDGIRTGPARRGRTR